LGKWEVKSNGAFAIFKDLRIGGFSFKKGFYYAKNHINFKKLIRDRKKWYQG